MVLMGCDPDDKAKLGETQKGAGPLYAVSRVASVLSAAVLGKIIAIATVNTALYGIEDRARRMVGICDHGAADQRTFGKQPAKLYAINTGYQQVYNLATP
jgi:hypothetical protein